LIKESVFLKVAQKERKKERRKKTQELFFFEKHLGIWADLGSRVS
jgi:hypothetical protein